MSSDDYFGSWYVASTQASTHSRHTPSISLSPGQTDASFLCVPLGSCSGPHTCLDKLAAGFHWTEGKTRQIVVNREWLRISNSVFINFLLSGDAPSSSFAKATTTTSLSFPWLWSLYWQWHKILRVWEHSSLFCLLNFSAGSPRGTECLLWNPIEPYDESSNYQGCVM